MTDELYPVPSFEERLCEDTNRVVLTGRLAADPILVSECGGIKRAVALLRVRQGWAPGPRGTGVVRDSVTFTLQALGGEAEQLLQHREFDSVSLSGSLRYSGDRVVIRLHEIQRVTFPAMV